MEIQTFFLAENITRTGNRHDVRQAAVSRIDCTAEAQFPTRFTLPAMIVLRRENTSGDDPIRLRFDLVNEDGRLAGLPRGLLAEGVFPDGNRFFYLVAKIPFEFPKPGRYRLDITSDDELEESFYHYAIDVMPAGEV
jgi:hypothetical protein